MRVVPRRLNTAIAWCFMVGSFCFAIGCVPAYVDLVGTTAGLSTFVVGSIFFTSASFMQLLQAQTSDAMPGTTASKARIVWWHADRSDCGWLAAVTQFPGTIAFNVTTSAALIVGLTAQESDIRVWRPDAVGSLLFLVSSAYAIGALAGDERWWAPRAWAWWIAWLNMVGSIAFGVSAVGSYIVPSTGQYISSAWDVVGTFLGALCFLVGAALMLPLWRAAARASAPPEPTVR